MTIHKNEVVVRITTRVNVITAWIDSRIIIFDGSPDAQTIQNVKSIKADVYRTDLQFVILFYQPFGSSSRNEFVLLSRNGTTYKGILNTRGALRLPHINY